MLPREVAVPGSQKVSKATLELGTTWHGKEGVPAHGESGTGGRL